VPVLTAEIARLERELAALAAEFDRLWFDEGTDDRRLLREGARLHQTISARLAQLGAARAALIYGIVMERAAPEDPTAAH
jgi:hypothetical protein